MSYAGDAGQSPRGSISTLLTNVNIGVSRRHEKNMEPTQSHHRRTLRTAKKILHTNSEYICQQNLSTVVKELN